MRQVPFPIYNPDEPKSVWRHVLTPPEAQGDSFGTAVDQACQQDPSLLMILIGNNDALNAPVKSDMRELTDVRAFQDRYNALMETVLSCTERRASIVVGTIPNVASIPHMRNLGEELGAMPFTLPGVPEVVADSFTRHFENVFIRPRDQRGECHGNDRNGACLGGDEGGAKVGITIVGKTLAIRDLASLFSTLALDLSQAKVIRKIAGAKEITFKRKEVMRPDDLQRVQNSVDAFNRYIKGWAERPANGWPVMDMNDLFRDRTSACAESSLTKLNGLFTGTPRATRREGDSFRRGVGNSMLSWDGVHPNSAGYSLAANEAIRVLNEKLKTGDYGGLEKGTGIALVPNEAIKRLLIDTYLRLPRTRIYEYQISTVE